LLILVLFLVLSEKQGAIKDEKEDEYEEDRPKPALIRAIRVGR